MKIEPSTDEEFISAANNSGMILQPTMHLRWSKKVFYDGSIGQYTRILQQAFLDQNGQQHWIEIKIEQ